MGYRFLFDASYLGERYRRQLDIDRGKDEVVFGAVSYKNNKW